MNENNQENQRPSKMRGVVFPKAKYGVIAAIIIIVVGNIFYYKEFLIFSEYNCKSADSRNSFSSSSFDSASIIYPDKATHLR